MTPFSAWSFQRHSPTHMRGSALRRKFRHCCRYESLENRIVLDATVVFNEIMYNPAGDETLEFVELYNENATNIDLSGWSIEGGIDYTFPDPTVIDGRGYLVVAADPTGLATGGSFSDALGPFSQGQLSNGGEEIRLVTHAGRRMSRVDYDDGGDWPVGADGSGASLSRTSIHTNSELPESWSASTQVGGTPGADNFPDPSLLPPVTSTYVDSGSSVRVRVPTSAGNLTWNSVEWNEPGFDDAAAGGWFDAAVGLGFDTSGSTSIADQLDAQGDIESQMYTRNATSLIRIPFNVNDASTLSDLELTVDYNDGYVAYLNGTEISRQNAPVSLAFNATATTTVSESGAAGDSTLINTYVGATNPLGNQPGGGPAVSNISVTAGPARYLASPAYDSYRLVDGTGFSSWSNKPAAGQNWIDVDGDGVPEIDSEVDHGMMSLMTSGNRQADQWISFDLGQSTELDKMWIWGFNEINRGSCPAGRCTLRGVSAARIWYSDAVSPTPATNPSTANWTLLGDITIPQGTGINGFDNVTEVLFQGAQARHVLIDVESTHGLDQGNGDIFVGLSEVQFFSGSGSTDTGRETLDLSAHLQQLVDGENLLAIHGLNESASDHTFLIKPTLSATQVFEPVANLTDALVINEVAPATDATFWLELANVGSEPINVADVVVTADGVSGGSHTLNSESLPAGGTLYLTEETLGFDAVTGDRLFVYSASQTSLIDAREVTNRLRGRTAEGRWLYPAAPTPGATNEFAFQSDVVINEIMFHHQPSKGSVDGVPGEYASTVLVEIDASTPWRYNQSGQNLGSSWAQVAHGIDSVNWFQGPAPLGFESSSLPEAIRTELTDPALNTPFVNTYYFETDFTFSGDPADFVDLQLRHLIDDGAVFYLNGVELTRHNMPGSMGSPVFAGDYASTAINNATFSNTTDPHSIVANELVSGKNRLSVEVHQINLTSSDIVMAVELTARKEITAGFSSSGYLEINEEWFELYNRNAVQSVDLTGWSVAGGIRYDFPAGTSIGPHDYLVVANDAATLRTEFPEVASKIIGDFSGRLSNKDDLILLRDTSKNPADEVHYFDGGRWPQFADGGGSSLELRDPDSDNAQAEAWAASDETSKSEWQTYTMRHTAHADTGPNSGFNEYIVSLLNDGEVLIDDIHVVEDPDGLNRELIQNGTFELDWIGASPSKWRIMENHHGTVIDDPDNPGSNKVLHLRATGRHDIVSNLAETTLKAGNSFVSVQNGREYEISLRAKWLTGCSRLNSRFFVSRVMRTDLLKVPLDNGTPGVQNSRFTANAGPTYRELSHSPILPAAGKNITVSTVVDDPDTIASMTLFWNVNGGSFTSAAMNHQGNGKYSAIISGNSSSSKIQFYVQGQDMLGAVSTFPANGSDSRAMIQVQDGQETTRPIDTVRIIMTTAETNALFDTTKIKSDELRGATVVYNNHEVFYDVGVRLVGSVHGRHNPQRQGSYKIRFHPHQPFRGVLETIVFDGSGNSALKPGHGHDEILTKTLINRAGGALASQYDDVGYLIAPRSQHTSPVVMELARYNNPFLEETYGSSDGTLFELEAINWVPNTIGGTEGFKNAAPLFSTKIVANTDISNLGDDKENYRWNFLIKNHRNRDDYSRIIEMAKAFDFSGSALDTAMEELIDMDSWLRTLAMNALIREGDFYTMGAQFAHNLMMYVRPSDGKVVAMPWDNDHGYGSTHGELIGSNQWNLTQIAKRPQNLRRYYGHMLDLIDQSFNQSYAAPWAAHLGSLTGEYYSHASWLGSRASSVTSQIQNAAPEVAFTITSSNPLDVGSSDTATVTGEGWVNVEQIRLTNSDQPLDLTWSAAGGSSYANTWQTTIPVAANSSWLTLEAYDFQGNVLGTDSIVINSTVTNDIVGSLRISEINYHPVDPTSIERGAGFTDDDDFEFIELVNISSQPIALGGVRFTEGVNYTFPLTTSALAGGDRILVVRNQAAFESRYGAGINIAGEYSGRLSNNGERIRLETGLAETILDFSYGDTAPWYERTDGVGGTLVANDVAGTPVEQFEKHYHWRGSTEFGGSPAAANADPVGIVINEVLTQTDPPVAESDSIELYNPTGIPISITDWYLSDSDGDLLKHQLPAMSLAAGGYLVLDERDFNPTPGVDPSFALSGTRGDDVWLTISDGTGGVLSFVDDVHFSAAPNGESLGRFPNGTGRLAPMQNTTLGTANDRVRVGPLVISEVHYHPRNVFPALLDIEPTLSENDLEFVEIYNPTPHEVDLTGWRIENGIDFNFPSGTMLGPAEFLVVLPFDPASNLHANHLAAFRELHGLKESVMVLGGFAGNLSNGGEQISLQRPGHPSLGEPAFTPYLLEDDLQYDDLAPWPTESDGSGKSLQRTLSDSWSHDSASWISGPVSPGRYRPPVFSVAFEPTTSVIIGETGQVTDLTHQTQTVTLTKSYTQPIVFVTPPSFVGIDPVVVRVNNVQSNQFDLFLSEPSNLNGIHGAAETITYVVLEAGSHVLESGAFLEVGTVNTNATVGKVVASPAWETVTFETPFLSSPTVMTQVQSSAGEPYLSTRQNSIQTNSFQVSLQQEESIMTTHSSINVGYLAIESGRGNWNEIPYEAFTTPANFTDQFTTLTFSQPFAEPPSFIASLASFFGGDNAILRYTTPSASNVGIKIDEDTTRDIETTHIGEEVSYLAIGGQGILTASDTPISDGELQTFELDVTTTGRITDMTVFLTFLHTRTEDLDVFLESPRGTIVELFTDVGGGGSHFITTTLDDQAPQEITTGSAPFSGMFRPEGKLSSLRGEQAKGQWKLHVWDDTVNGNTGVLADWSLHLELPTSLVGNLNHDSQLNAGDIDLMFAKIGSHDPTFDLNYDGEVNYDDVDHLVLNIMGTHYGDTDLDQDLDSVDFSQLVRHFDPLGSNSFASWSSGNFDGDRDIDINDFNLMATNFAPLGYPAENVVLSNSASVPDPNHSLDRSSANPYEHAETGLSPVDPFTAEPAETVSHTLNSTAEITSVHYVSGFTAQDTTLHISPKKRPVLQTDMDTGFV